MDPLPISVCIISGAEAHRIRVTLDSVAGWTRQIAIVINDTVQDGTEEIALSYGAQVRRKVWGGFGPQKNAATEMADSEWVLSLDADEAVSAPLREEIHNLFQDGTEKIQHAGYEFPRCTYFGGRWIKHGDWYPDRVRRLWKRGCGRWEGLEPHPYVTVQGSIGRLKQDLLHYSFENIDQQLAKIGPYSEYFVQHCLEQGRRAGAFDLAIRPGWRFLRAYFFRLGFLDGWPGFYISWMGAFAALTRYMKVREAYLKKAKLEAK